MTTVSDPSQRILELAAALDFRAAAPLTESLLAMRGTALTIDASRVERIGGQCLQVLLSAQQTWSADDTALSFTNLTPGFVEGLRLLGFSEADFTKEEMPE
ncbi:STAS domain-containing protein [Aminobacter ciceronei]|uniref:Chemotaxis protein CheX n=1 Tax=Aminobacter ciceronei TaxID=150723 RepID=A0ABR6CGZ6_9HYPH|nr:STAS domain-containing protein [Aminobacter ciceronei]MBA8910524.1 chemotaxis protein CheX [Aminobacter ciceronei]MBA9024295.1 chemotaxis protein CheX [Aminobacter ciceronei]